MCKVVKTPIYNAAINGHVDACHLLLEYQTDINALHMRHALFEAVIHGHLDICKLLLKDYGMDPNSIICDDLYDGTVMLAAIEYDHYNIVELLLECGASNCKIDEYISPLKKVVVYRNNYTICELLLDHGAHPDDNVTDVLNITTPLYHALYDRRVDICKLLISRGATTSKDVVRYISDPTDLTLEHYLADILKQMSE